MAKRFLTEADINYLEKRLGQVFATKEDFQKYRDQVMVKLDKILGEILASRQEQTVLSHQVAGHEDRIVRIEQKFSP